MVSKVSKYEPHHEKTHLCHICEQQRHRSTCTSVQISPLFIHCLDNIIPIVAIFKISRVKLVSAAEQAGLDITWWQIPEDRFSHDMAHIQQPHESK